VGEGSFASTKRLVLGAHGWAMQSVRGHVARDPSKAAIAHELIALHASDTPEMHGWGLLRKSRLDATNLHGRIFMKLNVVIIILPL